MKGHSKGFYIQTFWVVLKIPYFWEILNIWIMPKYTTISDTITTQQFFVCINSIKNWKGTWLLFILYSEIFYYVWNSKLMLDCILEWYTFDIIRLIVSQVCWRRRLKGVAEERVIVCQIHKELFNIQPSAGSCLALKAISPQLLISTAPRSVFLVLIK